MKLGVAKLSTLDLAAKPIQAPKIIEKVVPLSGAKLSPLCMTGLIDNEGCLQVIRGFVGGFPKLATNRKQKAVFIELLTQLKSLVLQKLLRRIDMTF